MCLSCGCGQPNESHGNPDHITLDQLQRAGAAAEISTEEAAANIERAVLGADRGAWTPDAGSDQRPDQPRDHADDEPVVTESHGSVM
jgi:hypothetical protein